MLTVSTSPSAGRAHPCLIELIPLVSVRNAMPEIEAIRARGSMAVSTGCVTSFARSRHIAAVEARRRADLLAAFSWPYGVPETWSEDSDCHVYRESSDEISGLFGKCVTGGTIRHRSILTIGRTGKPSPTYHSDVEGSGPNSLGSLRSTTR